MKRPICDLSPVGGKSVGQIPLAKSWFDDSDLPSMEDRKTLGEKASRRFFSGGAYSKIPDSECRNRPDC